MAHDRSGSVADDIAALGWPPLLTTPRAVAYTGCSKWAILRAVRAGILVPAGRRGRVFVFRRAELEAWLLGAQAEAPTGPLASITPISRARARGAVADSLERLRNAAKGQVVMAGPRLVRDPEPCGLPPRVISDDPNRLPNAIAAVLGCTDEQVILVVAAIMSYLDRPSIEAIARGARARDELLDRLAQTDDDGARTT